MADEDESIHEVPNSDENSTEEPMKLDHAEGKKIFPKLL